MKNIGTKIFILIAAIGMAVIAVGYFYKTIISPPVTVQMVDVHSELLAGLYEDFSTLESRQFNDSLYEVLNDKYYLYEKEGFITDDNRTSLAERLINSYTPVFVEQSLALFEQSKWYSSNHKAILNRINSLNNLERAANIQTLQNYDTDIRRIKSIIKDYNSAYRVSKYSKYINVEDANSKIRMAERYLNMSPLNNCVALCNKLKQVRLKIGNSHYIFVQVKVNKLRNYMHVSESAFDKMVYEANSAINDYINNADRYGSAAKEVDGFIQDARNLYSNAKNYYRNRY